MLGRGVTSECQLEVAIFAGVRSFCTKISGRRRRSPPTICTRLDRPVNALKVCRRKFSHKETL